MNTVECIIKGPSLAAPTYCLQLTLGLPPDSVWFLTEAKHVLAVSLENIFFFMNWDNLVVFFECFCEGSWGLQLPHQMQVHWLFFPNKHLSWARGTWNVPRARKSPLVLFPMVLQIRNTETFKYIHTSLCTNTTHNWCLPANCAPLRSESRMQLLHTAHLGDGWCVASWQLQPFSPPSQKIPWKWSKLILSVS